MLIAMFAAATLSQVRAAPSDVRAFIERRQECNHWAGEDAYDKPRGEEIKAAVRRLRCDKLKVDEASLRRRFRKDDLVLELLTGTADWTE